MLHSEIRLYCQKIFDGGLSEETSRHPPWWWLGLISSTRKHDNFVFCGVDEDRLRHNYSETSLTNLCKCWQTWTLFTNKTVLSDEDIWYRTFCKVSRHLPRWGLEMCFFYEPRTLTLTATIPRCHSPMLKSTNPRTCSERKYRWRYRPYIAPKGC